MPSRLFRALPALILPLPLLTALLAPSARAQFPAAPTLTSVHTFSAADPNTGANADGNNPSCALLPGGDGFLYGTTEHGGGADNGTVFRLHPNGAGFQVLHDFGSGTLGAGPTTRLISGGDGFLYGTTLNGGANSYGTVFRLHPDGTGYQDLHDFTGTDGQFPGAALLAPGDGFLYGRTALAVFRLHPDGTGFGNVYVFTDSTIDSIGALIAPGDGYLYGTTSSGGGPNFNAKATVFRLHPDGTGYQEVYVFNGTNTLTLSGALLAPGDGFLYGTTQSGGTGAGSVFRLHPDGTGFQDLHDFSGTDGSAPNGALVVGGDGFLYGEAQQGGASGDGTVFRLHPDGTGFADLHDFTGADGLFPLGEPVVLGDGFLYGTTQQGGANFTGTVYRLTGPPVTHVLWNNPDGRTIFWDVNALGGYVIAGNYPHYQETSSDSTAYTAVALSTGPDGVSHLLWTDPAGVTYLWAVEADGSHVDTFYGPFSDDGTASTLWKAVAVSTGGDGVTHVLWSNPNGRTILWDVARDGSFTIAGNYDGFSDDGTANTVWRASALASGPDGLSHVLWHNPDGKTLLWDLNAQAQPTPHTYPAFSDDGSASTLWQARAVSVGPDGVPHLLWNNPDGRTILWNVNAQGGFSIAANYGPFQDDASGHTSYTAVSLTTGLDALSHFAWDNPDGNTYLWSVQTNGGFTPTFYPPFLDNGTSDTIWKAVTVSAANAASTTVGTN